MYEAKKTDTPVSKALNSQAMQAILGQALSEDKARTAVIQNALTVQQRYPQVNGFSIIQSCIEVSKYSFGRDDDYYMYPYGNNIQLQISYKGYRELALRTGSFSEINAVEVLSCDTVKRDRSTGAIIVEFEEDYNKTIDCEVVGYLAYAIAKDGYKNQIYMTKKQVEQHALKYSSGYQRDKNKGIKSCPWSTEFDSMAKKTVLKKLCNQLPASVEMQNALRVDQAIITSDGSIEYKDNPMNKYRNNNKQIGYEVTNSLFNNDTGEQVAPSDSVPCESMQPRE